MEMLHGSDGAYQNSPLETRLELIKVIETNGYTVQTEVVQGMCIVRVVDAHDRQVASSIHPYRFDFEFAFDEWNLWMANGATRSRTRKVAA